MGRRIGWVTVDLGTGGGQHRRQPDGHCGNVDLYPHRVCGLCLFREIVYLKLKQKKLDPGDIE